MSQWGIENESKRKRGKSRIESKKMGRNESIVDFINVYTNT